MHMAKCRWLILFPQYIYLQFMVFLWTPEFTFCFHFEKKKRSLEYDDESGLLKMHCPSNDHWRCMILLPSSHYLLFYNLRFGYKQYHFAIIFLKFSMEINAYCRDTGWGMSQEKFWFMHCCIYFNKFLVIWEQT